MELREARAAIAEAIEDGAEMDELEHGLIGERALSRERRDALWLFAWAHVERRELGRWRREWR
jgi:hypothetical protein